MAGSFPPKIRRAPGPGPRVGSSCGCPLPEQIDTDELFFDAIEHKVAFVPGEQFYGENPERNHMRINFSFVSKEQLVGGGTTPGRLHPQERL